MTLWKKIVLLVIAAAAVIAAGGAAVYNWIIVPKYIEPVIASASEALRDEDVQDVLTDVAQDLVRRGVIDETTFNNYMRQAEKYTAETETERETGGRDRTSIPSAEPQTDGGTDAVDDTMIQAQTARSSLGVANVRTSEDADGEAKINDSYSKRFGTEEREADERRQEEEIERYTLDQESAEELDPSVQEALDETRAKRIYDRIMAAMSAHEKAVFWSVMGQTDADTLLSLYQTGDESGAKEYLRSVLSDDEYSEAVAIFFKYAPMLME
ncbi:MAG TPA: hypothetical protein IAA60_01355 [Candidatus Ornithomonoglobus intestinigallinarum]|uniref:Uncharacterized protein n=1 Tax=Candidatus Ornithomonoglobus intestinigallinarum TaxID=2840894 RepID=A0A9D1H2W4_9FIRM|nr:hypothetical protein [Candidatus Ornithomonoglobus intestinigallinarum]